MSGLTTDSPQRIFPKRLKPKTQTTPTPTGTPTASPTPTIAPTAPPTPFPYKCVCKGCIENKAAGWDIHDIDTPRDSCGQFKFFESKNPTPQEPNACPPTPLPHHAPRWPRRPTFRHPAGRHLHLRILRHRPSVTSFAHLDLLTFTPPKLPFTCPLLP